MSLLYRASVKELSQIRNKIFLERGIPTLYNRGFSKSPFLKADYGWHPSSGFFYELCRLSDGLFLEFVKASIIRGDRWIQVRLNIFELSPQVSSLDQLDGLDGLQFNLPPNSFSEMRLHADGVRGIPLLSYDSMAEKHKLKSYFSKGGLERRAIRLGENIEKDLHNIDRFIGRWHELHKPIITNWEGKIDGFNSMTVNERLAASGLLQEFEMAKRKNKERARQILGWLSIDERAIEQAINSSGR